MRILQSPLGTVRIAPVGDLFQYAWEAILEVKEAEGSGPRSIALTGGSTPKAFYQWVRETAANQSWPQDLWWTTSDERFVPLDSPESNQGNAWRELCAPLGVSKQQMALWQTETLTPEQAAQAQSKFFAE